MGLSGRAIRATDGLANDAAGEYYGRLVLLRVGCEGLVCSLSDACLSVVAVAAPCRPSSHVLFPTRRLSLAAHPPRLS